MDRTQFNFAGLQATGMPSADGDIAFDDEPCAPTNVQSKVITLHGQND